MNLIEMYAQQRLTMIDNRKLLIIEDALAQNNFFDCDVIQECINELEKETNLEQIIFKSFDLKNAVEYRGGRTKKMNDLINELMTLQIKKLLNI
jgi:hypothetical protein